MYKNLQIILLKNVIVNKITKKNISKKNFVKKFRSKKIPKKFVKQIQFQKKHCAFLLLKNFIVPNFFFQISLVLKKIVKFHCIKISL